PRSTLFPYTTLFRSRTAKKIRRPGYVRTPVPFSCSAKRKVPKRRPPRCRALSAYPVLPARPRRLWKSHDAPKGAHVLKQSSPTSPRSSELLGATQGPQIREAAVLIGHNKRSALHGNQYVVRVTSGRRYLSLVRPRERYQREGRPGVARGARNPVLPARPRRLWNSHDAPK